MKNGKKGYWFSIVIVAILMITISVVISIIFLNNEKAKSSNVTVITESYIGQGVIYEITKNDIIIVTTAHVLTGLSVGDSTTITFQDENNIQAQIQYISDTADLSFVKIDLVTQTQIDTKNIQAVKKDRKIFDQISEGNKVYAGDFGEGEMIDPFIFLNDFNIDMMLIRLKAKAGMSGCGIFDKQGVFLGIVCGNNEDETAVLPYSIIESEWSMVEN